MNEVALTAFSITCSTDIHVFNNVVHSPIELIGPAIGLMILLAMWIFLVVVLLARRQWIALAIVSVSMMIAVVILGIWLKTHYVWM